MRNAAVLLATSMLGLLVAGCNSGGGESASNAPGGGASANSAAGGGKSIAVIPMGTTHEYWKSLEAGANEASKELGVTIQWKGPLKEGDRSGQISVVQNFVSEGVGAIVLAPTDSAALARPVAEAMAKKIPVIIVDSPLKGEAGKEYTGLVATDNREGGKLGAQRLIELMGGKGKVVLLRNTEGAASTLAREEGFLEEVKKHPGVEVLVDNAYGGRTQSEAQTKAMQMVDVLKQANGVFASNESATGGMLQALVANGLAGKVKFVGFDSSPTLLDALKAGNIDALVVQNPRKMGYDGVKAAYAAMQGKPVEANENTGVTLVDKKNLDSEDVKKLLPGS